MLRYLAKTLFAGVVSLFVLITITFFLVHAIPGGPFSAAEEKNVPQFVIDRMNEKFGLNDPVYVQYGRYMKSILKGDLGISYKKQNTTVNEIVEQGFPVSAKVGAWAVLVAVIVGIILGILSAIYKNTFIDWFCRIFATIGVSVPGFVIGVFLLYFFAVYLGLFRTMGLQSWKDYVLPVAGLSFTPIAYISRLMRSSMLENMQQDYIRTARAKGVKEFFVIVKHALRNSIIPIVSYVGPLIAALLTGSFVIERLFTIPGIGRFFVMGITDRDYTIVLGMTIFFGGLLILCNILVDAVYVVIDPRIKFDE